VDGISIVGVQNRGYDPLAVAALLGAVDALINHFEITGVIE
jgi:hypothetical protein